MIADFDKFKAATPNLSGPERLRVFEGLRPELQRCCWQRLAEKLEGERVLDGVLTLRRRKRRPPPGRSTSGRAAFRRGADDPLLDIDPPVYVEALTGQSPAEGRALCPWHEDRNPSLTVYETADRGVYCFVCNRGGSIYDYASQVFGLETRGEDFKILRRRISERLLNTPVAA